MVVTAVCVVLQAMVFLTGMDITTVAINAGKVLYGLEVSRCMRQGSRVPSLTTGLHSSSFPTDG